MFTNINSKYKVSPEMSKYIMDQTNKWLEKYKYKSFNTSQYDFNSSNLVKAKHEDKNCHNCCFLLPFVSLLSFLAGYKFCKLSNN